MGEPKLTLDFASEEELADCAGKTAAAWRARQCFPLLVGLSGDLGAGKTTWARGMLRGLGYGGRVPSPTYTLLEQYAVPPLSVVHLDLYRLGGDEELEQLALRDWLDAPAVWLLVEWPERAPRLLERADLVVALSATGPTTRRLELVAKTGIGNRALEASRHFASK